MAIIAFCACEFKPCSEGYIDSSADWISVFRNLEEPRRAYEEITDVSRQSGENGRDH